MDHGVWPVRARPGDALSFLVQQEQASEEAQAVVHAFHRCGFTREEWQLLEDVPLRAFLWVATVDGPVREREPQSIIDTIREAVDRGGYDEASFTSLSTADYSAISPLVHETLGDA